MKTSYVAASMFLLATFSSVVGAPTSLSKRIDVHPSVTQILQYALTLEHLEDVFYKGAFDKFDEAAFAHAGLPTFARGRFVQIAEHEATHVTALTAALGPDAVAPCTYTFPYSDPVSFAGLAEALEEVGTAAYLGGAVDLVSAPDILGVAGSILVVEGCHNGWISSAVHYEQPWNGAFEASLDQNQVFTLAAGFITSCPDSNPALPFTANPGLTVQGTPKPGDIVKFDFETSESGTLYAAFLSGLTPTFVELTADKSAAIPEGLLGTVYVIITTNNYGAKDVDTVAGPAILSFPFDSTVSNAPA